MEDEQNLHNQPTKDEQSLNDGTIRKIIGINLTILLAYSLFALIGTASTQSREDWGYLIGMAIMIVLHVALLVILSIGFFFMGKRPAAQACLLSLFLVALIGFGSCLGIATLASK